MKNCCCNPKFTVTEKKDKFDVTIKMNLCQRCFQQYITYFGNGILNTVLEKLEDKKNETNS